MLFFTCLLSMVVCSLCHLNILWLKREKAIEKYQKANVGVWDGGNSHKNQKSQAIETHMKRKSTVKQKYHPRKCTSRKICIDKYYPVPVSTGKEPIQPRRHRNEAKYCSICITSTRREKNWSYLSCECQYIGILAIIFAQYTHKSECCRSYLPKTTSYSQIT